MNEEKWDLGRETSELRRENNRLRGRNRQLEQSRDMWRTKFRDLHRNFMARLREEKRK